MLSLLNEKQRGERKIRDGGVGEDGSNMGERLDV